MEIKGNGNPLQYSCLENPMGGGAWWAAVHGVAESGTQLSDFTFTSYYHALEKAMATHSSVLAWRIPGTGEPDRLPSMGWHRVGHYWSDLAAAAAVSSFVQVHPGAIPLLFLMIWCPPLPGIGRADIPSQEGFLFCLLADWGRPESSSYVHFFSVAFCTK